jgi:eukaryotic-like serine/threonine-protein kinase
MTTSTQPHAGSFQEGPPDLCGRTLADFHILRKLGQGGMGQVYLAEQVSLKRKVALKILRPDMSSEAKAKALSRFRREAEAVAQATHANIVQVYAYGEADGMPYMALEYVEGRNLREFITKKGPPDLLVSLSIMRQIAGALQRASELGIVHRDIKPENILLTRKGEVKVADFGLSCWHEGDHEQLNLTATGVTMGTPLYMSPEQVEGKAVDPRTDIYSFGVTCYHMLTGQPPFRGSTAFEVALQHVQKEAPALAKVRPDLPPLLCDIVHKMMAKNPANRYQTCRDLLRDVARVRESLGGMTVAVSPHTLKVEMVEAAPPSDNELVFDSPKPSSSSNYATVATRPPPLPPQSPPTSMKWLVAGAIGSLVLAAGLGVGLSWKDRRKAGPLPGTEGVRPADASLVEGVYLPSKREQALRMLVDQTLNVPKGKHPDKTGFGNCMDLGLLYLDEGRLDEAEKHFDRLARLEEASFLALGRAGKAIVLAVRNRAGESNKLLDMVFNPWGIPAQRGGKRVSPPPLIRANAPIAPLVNSPRGRDWLGRARWYNHKNGIKDDGVPRFLVLTFPLGEAKGKKE